MINDANSRHRIKEEVSRGTEETIETKLAIMRRERGKKVRKDKRYRKEEKKGESDFRSVGYGVVYVGVILLQSIAHPPPQPFSSSTAGYIYIEAHSS